MEKTTVLERPKFVLHEAVQDYYPDNFANCFGCGRNNDHGLHTKTYWDSEKEIGLCRFTPNPHHCGYKSVFHGGLLSSVIECNSVATAIAATYAAEGLVLNKDYVFYVMGSISARFSKPVPIDGEVVVKTKVTKLEAKKATCSVSVYGNDMLCSSAETVVIRVPDSIINNKFINEL